MARGAIWGAGEVPSQGFSGAADRLAGRRGPSCATCRRTKRRSYIEEGVQLLELAHNGHALFESPPAPEKRKVLDFILSNCTWKGGELTAKYRQPFDILAVAGALEQQRLVEGTPGTARDDIWLPTLDDFRTLAAVGRDLVCL
jgi:hypothetical protein